jgi:NAD(P)-dependent dehydrogenase (short-subunit alcohol dehydrogenase family)
MNSIITEHVVITGAAGNLGRATVRRFLDAGYKVSAIISPRNDPSFMTSPEIYVYQADLFDEEATEKTVQWIISDSGPVHTGIMIAGGFVDGSIHNTGMKQLKEMIDLNFVSAYHVARPLFMHMEQHGHGGLLVFIGARPALDTGMGRGMLAYALSKSMVMRLAEMISEEGRKCGVRTAVVIPGIIDTPVNRKNMPDADFSKWVTPEYIADNIIHLLTPAGKNLDEVILKVYGGDI